MAPRITKCKKSNKELILVEVSKIIQELTSLQIGFKIFKPTKHSHIQQTKRPKMKSSENVKKFREENGTIHKES